MNTSTDIDVTPLPRAPMLTRDEYTGRVLHPRRGAFEGHALTVGKLWAGLGVYLVDVDGARLAWADAGAIRRALDEQTSE